MAALHSLVSGLPDRYQAFELTNFRWAPGYNSIHAKLSAHAGLLTPAAFHSVATAGMATTPVQEWVPRIRLYFLSEDPEKYARRVAVAHQSRSEALQAMRYHLCIDSMPADDMHSLSVEQINRVLTLALNSKFLRVCCALGSCISQTPCTFQLGVLLTRLVYTPCVCLSLHGKLC